MTIEYRPIGIVHSPFTETSGTPTQPKRARGVRGTVEVFPELAEGLHDLDGFSHIVLLCHLHLSTGFQLKIVPHLETELRGLFATRSPRRPNPIGISVVKLLNIEGGLLQVEDIDLLEGTPVLDIKPFVGDIDEGTSVRFGWLDAVRAKAPSLKNED